MHEDVQQHLVFTNSEVKKLYDTLEDQAKIVETTAESMEELMRQLETLNLTIAGLKPDIEHQRGEESYEYEREMQDFESIVLVSLTIDTPPVISLL